MGGAERAHLGNQQKMEGFAMSQKVLIVEDDSNIAELLHLYLEKEGFETKVAKDGGKGVEYFRSFQPNLVLLDIMLPIMDGWTVLKKIREDSAAPVIMLTAKGETEDKVTGLDLGADDYLPKPFHLAELIARVKSVIRRNHHAGATYIEYGNIRIDPDHFQVFVAGTPIELNRKEYDILLYFIQRPERVINKMTLAESVWGDHIDQVDNFDFIYAQVKNLRKKLTEAGANAEVKAVYGFGYKMSLQAL